MRLIKLEISNFRAFYGHHELEFAHGDVKRVTVFHGENGSGKTNLLNAIHWCLTGRFTPRFQDQALLVNKEAYRENVRECCVELLFEEEPASGGHTYRVRRTSTNERGKTFDVYQVDDGNSKLVVNGEALLRRILPLGLVSWFFFDAEAIGSLELSGSETFKQDLRKTLGFDLVDKLLRDLDGVRSRRQREFSTQTNDRKLKELQDAIDRISLVLPDQHKRKEALAKEVEQIRVQAEEVHKQLTGLPQSEPLERQRRKLEGEKSKYKSDKGVLEAKAATLVGVAATPYFLKELTAELEGKLKEKEVRGKLPSPFSDKLVSDILYDKLCICGRPVLPDSEHAHKILDLLKVASTGALNERVSAVRYLLVDIERSNEDFPLAITEVRTRISEADIAIGRCEEEILSITKDLALIDVAEIQALETLRKELDKKRGVKDQELGSAISIITSNESKKKDFQAQYDAAAKKLAVGQKFKKELDKTTKLIAYIEKSLEQQERQALTILSIELNTVLNRYLTKHFRARIDPRTYAVDLLDAQNKRVGHSTGEGQVLKFAFIATVVALAAKKTQQKIEWMSEPTIAPLVLDAPFSALDPEYQSSVAKNLAAQASQLVLMISSAAWGERVATALESFVGARYLIVSKESGAQGDKPIKSLLINGTTHDLNEFSAPRDESTFVRIAS